LNESELLLVYDAIKELKEGKPLQYITGKAWFCGLELSVNEHVLIPRPETEELVQLIIKEHKETKGLRILDIGSGSGCIGIALKKELKDAEVWAMDISEEALKVARKNAELHEADICFIYKDILDAEGLSELRGLDIIVSNPPYVMESEKAVMHKNVLDFEPHEALFVPDNNPLKFYKAIFGLAKKNGKPCRVYVEINESKGEEMIFLAKEFGFSDICIHKDINGKDRIISATSH
ncbi:MAG: peptide chain release factor N(5)-glutamine methyltransferase, partial [Bacteroidota bacterium]